MGKKSLGREKSFEELCLSLEWKNGQELFRVSGGSEFQSRGQMTENAHLPRDVKTYGMLKTSESGDLVDTECSGKERLL